MKFKSDLSRTLTLIVEQRDSKTIWSPKKKNAKLFVNKLLSYPVMEKGLPLTLNSWLQTFLLMLKPSSVNDNEVRCHTQVKVT